MRTSQLTDQQIFLLYGNRTTAVPVEEVRGTWGYLISFFAASPSNFCSWAPR